MTKQLVSIEKKAGDFLQSLDATLSTYAVRKYDKNAFIKSAMIAIISSEGLQECLSSDIGKASIINAMRIAAGTGLSLNPLEGKSALIPYSKKQGNGWVKTAQFQIMKNGLIELALESGKVDFITADTVRENDDFTMSKTMNGDEYFFSPSRTDRGKIDGFFAAVKMKDGGCHTVYMAQKQTKEHREHFSKKTAMPDEGYGRKTVLKQLLNNLFISPEVSQAIGADNFEEAQLLDLPAQDGTGAEDLQAALETKKEDAAADSEQVEVVAEKKATPEKNSDSVI